MADRNYLEGVNWDKFTTPILPHQMTPEQFKSHPFAVHHGSSAVEGEEDVLQPKFQASELDANKGEHGKLSFAGGMDQAQEMARSIRYMEAGGERGYVHSYWAVPRPAELRQVYGDDMYNAGSEYGRGSGKDFISSYALNRNKHQFGYFQNKREGIREGISKFDQGYGTRPLENLSVATASPQTTFIPHSKFVEHAIRNGKVDEVHPRTMAMYTAGTLDTQFKDKPRVLRHSSPEFRVQEDGSVESVSLPKWDKTTFPEEKLVGSAQIDASKIAGLIKDGYSTRVRRTYGKLFRNISPNG